MATEELKVKFTVDAAGVKSGAADAKNEVKKAASEMASDVKHSSDTMESHLDKVADSTKGIGSAAREASNGVKALESDVSKASSAMEKDLSSVAKSMSAMKAFSMGARGIGIIGGLGQEIAKSYGADETASDIGTATSMGTTAMQGAAAGFAFAGPLGAVVGGLGGAASSLLKAGNDLQEAAKGQDQKAREDLEAQRQAILAERNRSNWTADAAGMNANQLEDSIDEQRRRIANLTEQRNQVALNYDPEDPYGSAERMRALNDSIAFAQEKLSIYTSALDAVNQEEEAKIKAIRDEIEERKREAVATRKEAEAKEKAAAKAEQAEREKREKEQQRIADAAHKAEVDKVKDEKREQESLIASTQRQLEGVISRPAQSPTDALTRIGGGRGYASYNNSTAQVQQRIENYLKSLVSTQKSQLQEISNKLDKLENITGGPATWQ